MGVTPGQPCPSAPRTAPARPPAHARTAPGPAPRPQDALLQLELLEGPLAGTVLQGDCTAGRYQVGRTRSSKLFQIKDPSISEKHAELVWRGGLWLVRDLGSSNGTFLNGQQLEAQGAGRASQGWVVGRVGHGRCRAPCASRAMARAHCLHPARPIGRSPSGAQATMCR